MHQRERTFTNWLYRFTKDNVALILSLREYEVALQAARRVPYEKIAAQHGVSVSRIKGIMKVVYGKLLVNNRSELQKFIL